MKEDRRLNFSKFAKSLAPDGGAIYEHDGQRWLASETALMRIPWNVRWTTGYSNTEMPEAITKVVDEIGCTQEATLTKAIMTIPDGTIRDCIRLYQTEDRTMTLPVRNDDWTLIQRSDLCEILYTYDIDTMMTKPKALLIKRYPELPDGDNELIGVIFPISEDITEGGTHHG